MIKEFLQNIRDRKQMQKQYEHEDHIVNRIAQKKKSSNERELERYLEERRQKHIEEQVKRIRKQKLHNYFHEKKLLSKDHSILKNQKYKEKSILKTRNIF